VWKAHPYRWPVIGWMKDIEAITREDCLGYFRTYYAPNNATLFVAGDFEPRNALKLIKKYYGGIKPGPQAPEVLDAEPEQKGERRAEVRHPAQAPTLMMAWRGPKASEADTLVLDVLQYALSVGQSSRLIKSLVYEKEVCVSVSIDWSWRKDPGAFVAAIELKPGSDARKAEEALYAEIDRVATEGLTDRELQKAKNNLSAQLLRELGTNNGRAHALGHYEALLGSWREGLGLASRYEQVTAQQVKEVAQKYLKPSRRSVVTLVPTLEAAA
jgi:predicted Zn-dependent peptidase